MRTLATILTLAALLIVPAPGPISGGVARAGFELPSFKNKLIDLALNQISSPGSFEITAGAIEEPGDGVTSLVDVTISDGEGVWLTLERLNFAWQPKLLLSGELVGGGFSYTVKVEHGSSDGESISYKELTSKSGKV